MKRFSVSLCLLVIIAYWTLDTGYWILDIDSGSGYWILDIRLYMVFSLPLPHLVWPGVTKLDSTPLFLCPYNLCFGNPASDELC